MNVLINASRSTLVGNIWRWRTARAKCAPYAAIPIRLIVGYGFLAHGLAKWHRGPDAFGAILGAIGVPSPQLMAWLTIGTELLSGIAILIGAFLSLVSIPAIIVLAVAVITVHLPYGLPPGYECDLLYISCILALVLIGPTPWSVDKYRSRAPLTRA